MRLIFFFYSLYIYRCAFSQHLPESINTSKGALAISASAERHDFYSSFTYIKPIKSFSLNPSIGFGVIHSFIQSNLFLRVGTDLIYNPLQKYFGGNQLITLLVLEEDIIFLFTIGHHLQHITNFVQDTY